jgi:methionyl aminopeptidase
VTVRSDREFADISAGGRILGTVLAELAAHTTPGTSTLELDRIAETRVAELGAEPSFKGYEGYPHALCTSVNAAVVHGIPRKDQILRSGDIVGLDLGVRYRGFFTDAAVTVGVGRVTAKAQRLLDVTRVALARGIAAVRVGGTVGDIGAAVQRHVEASGFAVVRQLVGHGVGRAVHEDPQVPNFGSPGSGPTITEGEVLAIEPMVTVGDPAVVTAPDRWTVRAADGSLAAHFEHTVVVTRRGAVVLTRLPD